MATRHTDAATFYNAITGLPSALWYHDDIGVFDEKKWKLFKQHLRKRNYLVATSAVDSQSGQTFLVSDAKEIQGERIIRIYSPTGEHDWHGDWS